MSVVVASQPRTGNIFGDVLDAVTSDPFFVIVGTALTAGSYGYVSGILNVTGAERIVVEESAKALAGMVGTAAQNFAACKLAGRRDAEGKLVECPVEAPGFFEGWAGQVAYRTKAMITAGAAGAVAPYIAQLGQWITPERLETLRNGWDLVRKTREYERDPEAASRAYLESKRQECLAQTAGPDNPNFRTLCRADVIAQATNVAVGGTVFDTTDWDVKTGDPPPPVTTNLTVGEALNAWMAALKSEGSADTPVVQRALAVYHAAKRRDEDITAARAARTERMQAAASAQDTLARACAGGDPNACAVTQHVPIGVQGAEASGEKMSLFAQGLLAAALTAPFWVPVIAWPIWKDRRRTKRKSR